MGQPGAGVRVQRYRSIQSSAEIKHLRPASSHHTTLACADSTASNSRTAAVTAASYGDEQLRSSTRQSGWRSSPA